jgi:hypothetical protein
MLMGGGYKNIVTEKTSTSTNIARQNVAIGYDALTLLQDAKNNVAVGNNALYSVKSDNTDYNVAVGYNAGYNTTSSLNTYVGAYAGYSTTLPAAVRNTAVGYLAGGGSSSSQISGYDNSYVGALAGTNITSGSRNVAVGFNALQKLTTGNDNIALGSEALANLTTGSYNVAIGYNACSQVTKGSYKTCIGANSGPHLGTTGTPSLSNPYMNATVDNIERTYIGSQPKYFGGDAVLELHNPPAPTSESDILRNGILQYLASTPSNTTTIVNGNLIVRGRVYFTSEAKLYQMYDLPGTSSTTGDFGLFGATGSSDVCASSAANYVFDCKANPFSVYSDRRLKNIGSKNLAGLDELAKIQVYNYTFKDDKNHSPHVGVIAQELQKVFPNSVFQGEDGFLRIKWDEMFYALINGVKELDKKIVALTTRTFKVESKISKLEKENVLLKSQVENLSLRVNKLKAEQ